MTLTPITQISKTYRVSTRTLRYYEELGLLESAKAEGYAYRVYDEAQIRRLNEILILRKLNVPLGTIAELFRKPDSESLLAVLSENLRQVNEEANRIRTLKSVLSVLVDRLKGALKTKDKIDFFQDETTGKVVEALNRAPNEFHKEVLSMREFKGFFKALSGLHDVRILRIAPTAVASYRSFGAEPEQEGGAVAAEMIRKTGLYKIKPDARAFGFNVPNPPEQGDHGYEHWLTVPDDFEVPAPFVKKRFAGGLYAAHAIALGDFDEWQLLAEWAEKNGRYRPRYGGGEGTMAGCLEEALTFVYCADRDEWSDGGQLDLLLPIEARP